MSLWAQAGSAVLATLTAQSPAGARTHPASGVLAAVRDANDVAGGGQHTTLLAIGALAAVAFAAAALSRRWLPVSEVVVFLAVGMAAGHSGLHVIADSTLRSLAPVTALALGAIVFLIGTQLDLTRLLPIGRTVVAISLVGSVATAGVTYLALRAFGLIPPVAFLLAALSPSTAPVTIRAVVSERKASGRLTEHLLAATALNNVATALLFGIGAPFAFVAMSPDADASTITTVFVRVLGLSAVIAALGFIALRIGLPHVTAVSHRFLLTWTVLLLVVGACRFTGTSVVIATLMLGAATANLLRSSAQGVFEAVRAMEAPIFLVFFLVTGAEVDLSLFLTLGEVGTIYVLARGVGRVLGSWAGSRLTAAGRRGGFGPWLGAAQLPYAGMAIGLASFTVEVADGLGLHDAGSTVAAIVLGSVVIFELVTPPMVDHTLRRSGEAKVTGRGTPHHSPLGLGAAAHLVTAHPWRGRYDADAGGEGGPDAAAGSSGRHRRPGPPADADSEAARDATAPTGSAASSRGPGEEPDGHELLLDD